MTGSSSSTGTLMEAKNRNNRSLMGTWNQSSTGCSTRTLIRKGEHGERATNQAIARGKGDKEIGPNRRNARKESVFLFI